MLPALSPGSQPWLPHHTLGTGAYTNLAFWELTSTVTAEHSPGEKGPQKGQSQVTVQAAHWEQFLAPSYSL